MKRSHVWIAVVICAMFAAMMIALFRFEPPSGAREALLIFAGSLASAFGAVVNYWFGSSSGSARKDELLARGEGPPKA